MKNETGKLEARKQESRKLEAEKRDSQIESLEAGSFFIKAKEIIGIKWKLVELLGKFVQIIGRKIKGTGDIYEK